jgi:hypothetical protein
MNQSQPPFSPPRSWLRFMLLLKVTITLALLIAELNLSSCTRQNLVLVGTPLKWEDAARIVPPELIHTVIQQTTSLSLEQQKVAPIKAARLGGKEDIVFLNFSQIPELCGELGCLIVAYYADRPHSPVWNSYVSPNLPRQIPLLAQTDDQTVPSLIVNQLKRAQIRQMLYTWGGSEYQLEKSIVNK